MKRFSTLPYALKYFALPFVIFAVLYYFKFYYIASVFGIVSAFILYFFRDPKRVPPNIPGAVVSPADGKVISVDKIDHPEFPDKKCIRVKIFLSIFNVHIQRAPMAGEIFSVLYSPGKFLNALKEKSSEDNENNLVGIQKGNVKIFVKQIAGVIARRIVCCCNIGDKLDKADKFGLICFGSRVEAYLPSNIDIRVKKGMKVYAGKTVLGIIPEGK